MPYRGYWPYGSTITHRPPYVADDWYGDPAPFGPLPAEAPESRWDPILTRNSTEAPNRVEAYIGAYRGSASLPDDLPGGPDAPYAEAAASAGAMGRAGAAGALGAGHQNSLELQTDHVNRQRVVISTRQISGGPIQYFTYSHYHTALFGPFTIGVVR